MEQYGDEELRDIKVIVDRTAEEQCPAYNLGLQLGQIKRIMGRMLFHSRQIEMGQSLIVKVDSLETQLEELKRGQEDLKKGQEESKAEIERKINQLLGLVQGLSRPSHSPDTSATPGTRVHSSGGIQVAQDGISAGSNNNKRGRGRPCGAERVHAGKEDNVRCQHCGNLYSKTYVKKHVKKHCRVVKELMNINAAINNMTSGGDSQGLSMDSVYATPPPSA